MATLFSVRVLRRSGFSGNLKSSYKTHLEAFNLISVLIGLAILPVMIPTVASNNLVLGELMN